MSSRFLPVIADNAELCVQEGVPLLAARSLDLRGIEVLCSGFRRRGICALFRGSIPEVLHADLQRSGAAFAFFLEGFEDGSKVTSRAAPLFDALAAGDIGGARVIASRTRTTWNAAEEYEDDFLYVLLVTKLLAPAGQEGEARALMERYEEVLQGATDVRLDLCRALLDRDGPAFDEGLQAFLAAYEARYREGMEQEYIIEEQWATEGQLCVEGLALLRLSDLLGLLTRRSYPYIPSNVRRKTASGFEAFSWRL